MKSSTNAKHYIQHWPHGRAPTFKQSKESQKTSMVTFFNEATRDKSEVVYVCDCADANKWHCGKLARHNKGSNPGKYSAFSKVETVLKPGNDHVCKFCGFYAIVARRSQLDDQGRLTERNIERVERGNRELGIGSEYGYLKVVDIKFGERKGNARISQTFVCACECGKQVEIARSYFGKAKSCGCKAYEHHKQLKLGAIARRQGVTNV